MAAVDLVAMFDMKWFGRPDPSDFGDGMLTPNPRPPPRRESASSMSDSGANEQVDAPGGMPGRERRQDANWHAARAMLGRHSRSNSAMQQQEEENGVLGTWAGRQRIFSDHLREKEQAAAHRANVAAAVAAGGGAAGAAAAAAAGVGASTDPNAAQHAGIRGTSPPLPAPAAAPAAAPQPASHPVENSYDKELHAAWRWRFHRKWHAEQMKQFEPAPPAGGSGGIAEGDEEEWTAALHLMDAVDGGLNMQIGRTLSLHNSSMVDSAGMSMADQSESLTLMSPGLAQCMLLDNSVKESPLREEAAAATTHLVSVARKAAHLRQQQQEIERQVSERWEAASGGGQWVAQHLPAVQIDSWSAFSWVLVRLSDQSSHRQKLLVRGRNGITEQQLFAAAEAEATRLAIAHRLASPRVELVASGRMEWVAAAPGRRRCLHIKAGRLHPAAAKDSRLRSVPSAGAVVAELARASFPGGDFDIVAGNGNSNSGGSSSNGGLGRLSAASAK